MLKENSNIKENYKNKIDGLELLSQIKDNSITSAFYDPQYRGVLDKLHYGNEGKGRGKDRCELQQMSEDIIKEFIKEIERVLKPSGYLFLWVDKFHLCTGVTDWLMNTEFQIVDLITWDKGKIGMGYRTRRKSEYLIIIQKKPIKAKSTWTLHNIPDVWSEKTTSNSLRQPKSTPKDKNSSSESEELRLASKTHPHSKPIELQKQLILATSNEQDYILDPASGGYSVFEACKLTNRNFIGGDIQFGE